MLPLGIKKKKEKKSVTRKINIKQKNMIEKYNSTIATDLFLDFFLFDVYLYFSTVFFFFQALCVLLLSGLFHSPVMPSYIQNDMSVCSRRNSELSCLMGCFKCAVLFGRMAYDMASCCTECHRTRALLIDDGPEHCSHKFFTNSKSSYGSDDYSVVSS